MASSGRKMPTMPWNIATQFVSVSRKISGLALTAWRSLASVDIAPAMGVPTAPKETGVLLKMSATMAAASGGKPSPTSSGPARAAGVPNPAAPSMKAPNIQPMMIAWTRRSCVMSLKPLLIVVMAPEIVSVFRIRMAPKMMTRTSNALSAPNTVNAAMCRKLIFQANRPTMTVRSQETGSAFFAGQLKLTIRTIATRMGRKARKAYISSILPLCVH